jgi:predicted Zn-dependent protease
MVNRKTLPFYLRPRKLAAICLSFSLALPVAPAVAYAQSLPELGGNERTALSSANERKLGEHIMRDIKRNRDYLSDAPVREYLSNFGARLLAALPEKRSDSDYDFFFFAVRDSRLNAFALPGGFIGVHSGLVLAAESESELASVMAHEIGHVTQHHIARMLGNQKGDALISMAAMLLGMIAAGSSPDLAQAAMMGGTGFAAQRQLNFSREAEREADRIGLQILRNAGFDPSGSVAFFERLQRASRVYTDNAPAYLRTHPMTTERIADLQSRIQSERYRQHADSLDFHLVRARLRTLQENTAQGRHEAAQFFKNQLTHPQLAQQIAAHYGLAGLALREGEATRAVTLLEEATAMLPQLSESVNGGAPLASMMIEARLAARQTPEALQAAKAARTRFPLSRSIALQYADALVASGQQQEAVDYLRDQLQLYRHEPELHQRLAKVYAAQRKLALQHTALAEYYALTDSLPAALDQLTLARQAPDASFHDLAVIDAREREFRERWLEELKETQKR